MFPYMLASQHPIIHWSLLITSAMVYSDNYEHITDENIPKLEDKGIFLSAESCFQYVWWMHITCIICDWAHKTLKYNYNATMASQIFVVLKVVIYMCTIIYV